MRLSVRLSLSYIALLLLLAITTVALAVWQVNGLARRVREIPSPASPFDAQKVAEHLAENGLASALPQRWLRATLDAGGWCQVVDSQGREVTAVSAPQDRKRAYSVVELAELLRRSSGPWVFEVAPVRSGDRVDGAVILAAPARDRRPMRIGLSYAFVQAFWRHFLNGLASAGLAALVLCAALGFLVARRLARPLVELSRGLRAVAGGDYSKRVPVRGRDEFAFLASSYNQLLDRLRSAATERDRIETARRNLVANISHDLRTPLTAIRGFTERMTDDETSPEERRRYAEVVARRVGELDALLGDLLELSRLQALPPVRREPVDLAETVREKLIAALPEIEDTGLELEVDISDDLPLVPADARLIGRALQNLLNNVLRHSGGAKHVTVSLRRLGDEVALEVEDDGPGIPAEELPFLFDRYYQGKSATEKGRGAGLGLAIVKEIAESHGGKAEVETGQGRGSRFRIRLPIGERPGVPAQDRVDAC